MRYLVALGATLAALSACRSYEPAPLDPAAHRAAWHGRTLEDVSLAEFVERLDRDLAGDAVEFDVADGLTLSEGRLVALVFNPGLRLARLRVGRAAASAQHAGLWADPQLAGTLLRITDNVPDRWFGNAALTFTLPVSGRLAAEEDLAEEQRNAAEQSALEAEWGVWNAVGAAWIEWSAARLRVEETERIVAALETLVATTAELARSGELVRTEASLFAVEQAQRRNQLLRLRGEVLATEQRLRALLGLAPEAPARFVPTLEPIGGAASRETAGMPATSRNPTLARLRADYEVAEQTLRREIRKQYPDLTLGPMFESDQGQSRIGLLGGLPIPFLNANRRAIAVATVGRELARAAFETEYERLAGRWAAATARAQALAEQRADVEQVLAPLVDRQLEDAAQLLRLGEESGLVLLESIARAYETKLALIETRRAEARARTELELLIGPAAPAVTADEEEETP